jgi:cysteine synthase A
VTVFPDDNKKYLSTDLLREEPPRDGHLTDEVELLGFRSFKRVCHTCCDPLECLPDVPKDFIAAESALPLCPRRAPGETSNLRSPPTLERN